jgi:hypothetical protein
MMRHIGRTHTHVIPLFGQLCIAVLFALAWAGNIMAQSTDITRQLKANSPSAKTNWLQLGHDNAHTGWNRSEKDVVAANGWKVQPSSNPSNHSNVLNSVSAVSPTVAFAVGIFSEPEGVFVPLAEHWDGSSWKATIPPDTRCGENTDIGTLLESVAAVSSNDAWAVGGCSGLKVILHWDGKGWNEVSAPQPCQFAATFLSGVTAISRNDVWAVGHWRAAGQPCRGGGDGFYRPLTLHWDGSRWKVFSVQLATQSNSFFLAVAGTSSRDVWAVGETDLPGNQPPGTLVEHWDGSRWTVVNSPGLNIELTGVVALTPKNAWAVGHYLDCNNHRCQDQIPVIEHWDGSTWTMFPAPKGKSARSLAAIAAVSPNDIWAVGSTGDLTPHFSLTLHWDGKRWSEIPSPPHGEADLSGVTALRGGDVWAVGSRLDDQNNVKTLVLFRSKK